LKRYENKTVLITGAGGGIGRALALRLGAEGGAIAVLDQVDEDERAAAPLGKRAATAKSQGSLNPRLTPG